MKEFFWDFLSASKDGDPSDPADEPGTAYTVEVEENAAFVVRTRRGESESIGRIDYGHGSDYKMELQVEAFGQSSRLTYQGLEYTDATDVLVSFLQRKDRPYVAFDEEEPGERVLSSAFGQLVPGWLEYPEEPVQLHMENWESVAQGAILAENATETWLSSASPPTGLETQVGLDLKRLGYADGDAAEVFQPAAPTPAAFAQEMEAVTGTRPSSLF